jgi:hypothetical protein
MNKNKHSQGEEDAVAAERERRRRERVRESRVGSVGRRERMWGGSKGPRSSSSSVSELSLSLSLSPSSSSKRTLRMGSWERRTRDAGGTFAKKTKICSSREGREVERE